MPAFHCELRPCYPSMVAQFVSFVVAVLCCAVQIDDNSSSNPYYMYLLTPGRYWSTDMNLQCFQGYHLYLVLILSGCIAGSLCRFLFCMLHSAGPLALMTVTMISRFAHNVLVFCWSCLLLDWSWPLGHQLICVLLVMAAPSSGIASTRGASFAPWGSCSASVSSKGS